MRYCPGREQELLSTLGVMKVRQDSRNFVMWKFPLSMIDALLKFTPLPNKVVHVVQA